MLAKCLDLKQLFGKLYRVTREASYHAEHGPNAVRKDPWNYILLCRHGHIYPQGGNRLAAATNNRGIIANRLKEMACVEVLQDGTDGVNVAFDVQDFARLAEIMQPRKRRQLTEEQKQKCKERFAKYRKTKD